MRQSRKTLVATALAILVLFAAVAPAPVAAQSGDDESPLGDLFTDDSPGANATNGIPAVSTILDTALDGVSSISSIASGFTKRASFALGIGEGPNANATKKAQQVDTYYDAHNASFEAWVNNRTNASTSYDVIALNFTIDGKTETRYLVGHVNSTSNDYENSSIVNSTSRSVDEWVTLSGFAAVKAPTELEKFYTEFVSQNRDVTPGYKTSLGAKYAGDITGSFPYLPTEPAEDTGIFGGD